MSRAHLMGALLLILAALIGACSTGSRERACDPVRQTGCASGRCAVNADGAPACVGTAAERPEGEACDAPDVCADGLGCIRVAGVARCLRFCATAGTSDECQSPGADDPVAAEVRDGALCAVAIPERTDLGACVLPCRPGGGDCPAGTRCGLAEAIGTLTCVPAGAVGEAEGCGGTLEGCGDGLVCAALGAGRICAPLVDDPAACALTTEPHALPVSIAAWACLPCQDLGPRTGGGRWGLCLAAAPLAGDGICAVDDATCGCGPFGTLARPAGTAAQLAARLAQSDGVEAWVDATRGAGGWAWGDGAPVADEDWAPGEPGAGDCAAIGLFGLVSADCAEGRPVACAAVEG